MDEADGSSLGVGGKQNLTAPPTASQYSAKRRSVAVIPITPHGLNYPQPGRVPRLGRYSSEAYCRKTA